MNEPFIQNHHYNIIKNQANAVLYSLRTVGDPKIVESVRLGAQAKVLELFPGLAGTPKALLESIVDLRTADDFLAYLQALEPYLLPFPQPTEKQIRKLFPKNKKLQLPDLANLDLRYVSYLSWTDIATQKMFILYPAADGTFHGLEGRFTPTPKKSYCFLCNKMEEVALFSAVSRKRPAHASPDYYQSVGNYLCANSQVCNSNITEVAPLEKFIHAVLGDPNSKSQ